MFGAHHVSNIRAFGEYMRKSILISLLILVSACNTRPTEPDAGVFSGPAIDFKGGCGEATNAPNVAESSGMQPLQQATINGQPVSSCVIGFSGAIVYGISLTNSEGPYPYAVVVDGRGPSRIGNGPFSLAFTDEAGDTYRIGLYSSSRAQHTLSYNSDKPKIVKIWWSNNHIDVPSLTAARPDYRVTSSADSRSRESGE